MDFYQIGNQLAALHIAFPIADIVFDNHFKSKYVAEQAQCLPRFAIKIFQLISFLQPGMQNLNSVISKLLVALRICSIRPYCN